MASLSGCAGGGSIAKPDRGGTIRIIVTGLVCLNPVGGVAWDYLQYPIGLMRLGHDVYYHEDTWSWPYNPVLKTYTDDGSYSANYLRGFFSEYAPELSDRWHYFHLHEHSHGMARSSFEEIARTADLFINVSGACLIPDSLNAGCRKVFVDTDPGYNQMVLVERPKWSENVERWCKTVAEHDVHLTYAENISGDDCTAPHAGLGWRVTRMPVVIDLWSEAAARYAPTGSPWTTVMTWNAFKGPLVHRGVEYKSKGAEFEKFLNIPHEINAPVTVAVGGKNPPVKKLISAGWHVVDGPAATRSPGDYQSFIRGSRGEFSTAKNVYVATRSGWFSCRSACYLASARPVVVQDTGFSRVLENQSGLLSFTDLPEAVDAIQSIERDYQRHARGALDVAQEHFESGKVLTALLDDAGC